MLISHRKGCVSVVERQHGRIPARHFALMSKSEREEAANSREGRRQFFERLARKHSVRQQQDWSRVAYRQVVAEEGGKEVLAHYGSLVEALKDCFPEQRLLPFLCRRNVPAGHWDSRENRREFCEYLKEKFSVREPEDWRKVHLDDIYAAGGKTLILRFGSFHGLLTDCYPELELHPRHTLQSYPKSFFDCPENCRRFMDECKKKLGVREKGDWKNVRYVELRGIANQLLRKHGSMLALLQAVYPEEGITATDCLPAVPKGHWDDKENRRAFMEKVRKEMGVENAGDWRRVRREDIQQLGGGGLLTKFSSVFELLDDTYPEQRLEELECRGHVSNAYWKDTANRRALLDRIAAAHSVKCPSDWKRVSWRDVAAFPGGNTLLSFYDSMLDALRHIYPEQEWSETGCRPHARRGYWDTSEAVAAFLEKARAELHIKEKSDWYRVSRKQIGALGGSSMLKRMTLCEALRTAYPEETWDEVDFAAKVKKSVQRVLGVYVQQLYPGYTVLEEHCHPVLGNMELDFFLPELNLAFEYNGEHHYRSIPVFGVLEQYRRRDAEKVARCEQNGIKLITVPYWWDNSLASLAATVAQADQGLLAAAEDAVGRQARGPEDGAGVDVMTILGSVRAGEIAPIEPFEEEADPGVMDIRQGSSVAGVAGDAFDSLADPTGSYMCVDAGSVRVRVNEGRLASLASSHYIPAPTDWLSELPRDTEVEGRLLRAHGTGMDKEVTESLATTD